MEGMLSRYLDGELDEREAAIFLEAVDRDPRLEAQLRAYERILAATQQIPQPLPSADFTQTVMAEVRAAGRPVHRAPAPRPLGGLRGRALAAAAAVVLLFGAGWMSARLTLPGPALEDGTIAPPSAATLSPASWSAPLPGNPDLCVVRLVYVPGESNVGKVTVAGSFNGWDPEDVALQRQDGVWSTFLILPRDAYEYMFVEDGERWVTDPGASQTREDGFGGRNAVLDLRV